MASNRARRVIAQQWVSVDGFAAGPTGEGEIFAVVDELDLFVAPIALGSGTALVAPGGPYRLRQIEAEVWPSATHIRYEVDRAQA